MNIEAKRDPRRQCSAPGCTTVLSMYNSDHLCFTHADVASRARFEPRGPARIEREPYRQRIDASSGTLVVATPEHRRLKVDPRGFEPPEPLSAAASAMGLG